MPFALCYAGSDPCLSEDLSCTQKQLRQLDGTVLTGKAQSASFASAAASTGSGRWGQARHHTGNSAVAEEFAASVKVKRLSSVHPAQHRCSNAGLERSYQARISGLKDICSFDGGKFAPGSRDERPPNCCAMATSHLVDLLRQSDPTHNGSAPPSLNFSRSCAGPQNSEGLPFPIISVHGCNVLSLVLRPVDAKGRKG